ncbi:MAG TPA: hypothetical protein VN849_16425 [Stellaceae bacterium]|jgi:hypothetical protein|nr:hypothetical protein [Stellaceae bacterium]
MIILSDGAGPLRIGRIGGIGATADIVAIVDHCCVPKNSPWHQTINGTAVAPLLPPGETYMFALGLA